MIQISLGELALVMIAISTTSAVVSSGPGEWKAAAIFGILFGFACFAIYNPLRMAIVG